MALINCPECGKKISDKADACIHCGYPIQRQHKSELDKINKIMSERLEKTDNSILNIDFPVGWFFN